MDIKKLDLNLLVTLDALLAERNVTKAADKLGLSQPAVSAQLARLRDVFDDQLLVPAQRGMTPTARALELRQPLHAALDGVRDVISSGASFDPGTGNLDVAIAATDMAQYAQLMPFALDLRARAPGVRIALRSFDYRSIDKLMEDGEVDLALMVPTLAPDTLRSRKLLQDRFVLIARKNHPVVRSRITLEQFVELDHVITEPRAATFRGLTDTALEALGKSRRVVMSASNFMICADVVARSDIIALVPESMVLDRVDRLQIIDPPLVVETPPIMMLWHQRTHGHAGHRWVRDALHDYVQMAG